MALVEKYKLGNTEIEIYDDYFKGKSQQDIDMILERIAEIARNAIYELEVRK
jgi:hypothetical protein